MKMKTRVGEDWLLSRRESLVWGVFGRWASRVFRSGKRWRLSNFGGWFFFRGNRKKLAEREGFEPSKSINPYTLSRRAPSATRTPLQVRGVCVYKAHPNDFGGGPPSHTSALESAVSAAPFRA